MIRLRNDRIFRHFPPPLTRSHVDVFVCEQSGVKKSAKTVLNTSRHRVGHQCFSSEFFLFKRVKENSQRLR